MFHHCLSYVILDQNTKVASHFIIFESLAFLQSNRTSSQIITFKSSFRTHFRFFILHFSHFVLMAIDYDPFCSVCGGPFSHVDLLDFSQLEDDEQYLKETAYNMEILPLAQIAVSSRC